MFLFVYFPQHVMTFDSRLSEMRPIEQWSFSCKTVSSRCGFAWTSMINLDIFTIKCSIKKINKFRDPNNWNTVKHQSLLLPSSVHKWSQETCLSSKQRATFIFITGRWQKFPEDATLIRNPVFFTAAAGGGGDGDTKTRSIISMRMDNYWRDT